MRVHYVSKFDEPWRTERFVADALAWHGCSVERYDISNLWAVKDAASPGDIVLTSVPQLLDVEALTVIKKCGARLVAWYFDWIWDYCDREQHYLPRLKLMDHIFSTDGFDDAEYRKRGITCRHWLPQAAPCAPLLWPADNIPACDILFVGKLRPESRVEMLESLQKHWNVHIIGNGNRRIWGHELSSYCQKAKIVLGDNFRSDIPGYWSSRIYLTMAAGGFYLGPIVCGIGGQFESGLDCGFIYPGDDIVDAVDCWMTHERERQTCRSNGFAKVMSYHTFYHRVGQMLAVLGQAGA